MARFIIKNLPTGFVYLIPPPRIRPLVKRYGDYFTTVEYGGISSSEQNVAKWELGLSPRNFRLGILYSEDDSADGEWRFLLQLDGVREINLPREPEEIASKLLSDIETRIENSVALPSTASRNVGDLFFGFRMNVDTREAEYYSFVPSSA